MTNVSKSFHYVVTFKVGLSPSKQSSCYLVQRKPFKIDKKCFLFHLKSSFRSRDIYIFVLTFWSCRKKGLIRKIRLINFKIYHVTNWLTKSYIHILWAIYILLNISQSKGNQTLKFGQVKEYNKRNIFL